MGIDASLIRQIEFILRNEYEQLYSQIGGLMKKIESVQSFIEEIKNERFIRDNRTQGKYIVYRGQSSVKYELLPSLFRIARLNSFEYDQIHFLKASRFVENSCELEIAIQAQHFGYPTRLLDVSFSSLVALFFSCYDKSEISEDDGKVFIITTSRFIPPTSSEMQSLYSDIILNADFFNSYADKMQPVIVENIKNNDRIIAQHGAFFLFLSDRKIDETNYIEITIVGKKKNDILIELDELFEINEGTMFPDISMNVKRFERLNSQLSYSFDFSKVSRIKFTLIENHLNEMINACEDKLKSTKLTWFQKDILYRRYYRNIVYQIDQYKKMNEVNSIESLILLEIEKRVTKLRGASQKNG